MRTAALLLLMTLFSASVLGAQVEVRPGGPGEVVSLAPGRAVRVPAPDLSGNRFSAALWVRIAPSLANTGRLGMILTIGTGYWDGFRLSVRPTRKGFCPRLEIGRRPNAFGVSSKVPMPAGTWSHLAATWDGATARLYVNGEEAASQPYSGDYVHKGKPSLALGAAGFGLDFFPFDTDGATVCDAVLAPDEVARLASARSREPDAAAIRLQNDLFDILDGTCTDPERVKELERSASVASPLIREQVAKAQAFAKRCAERKAKGETGPICTTLSEPLPRKLPPANPPVMAGETRFFVSPGGDDSASGTQEAPFRTLARARDAVRALKRAKGLPPGGVAVFLRGGTYRMEETLELGEEDAGEPGRPVLWSAWADERPVLDGGFSVGGLAPVSEASALARIPAAARARVRVADVKAQGFASFDPEPQTGYHAGENATGNPVTDLYADGKPLQLAREPNKGWFRFSKGNVTNKTFHTELDGGDWQRWTREPELMATGYWTHYWADLTTPVTSVDPAAKTLTIGKARGLSRLVDSHPFFLVNALCALDAPGEWFLDRASGKLYVWPKEGTKTFTLSSFSRPFVVLKGVHDFELRGLVFQYGRSAAVVSKGCERVTFAENLIRNFGGDALHALGARDVTIRGNVMHTFGHGALRVSGGDRRTLTPSGVVVVGNDIGDVERRRRTYAPGLHLDGCGTQVVRNNFHDMASSAMRIEGNDHWVASNVVERCVTESDDQGGIDIYANPTYAGVRIVHNVWRDIGCGGENAPCGQAGVRFDDAVSTMLVYGNRFVRCGFGHFGAVQMNGGRRNTVDNNVFVDCGCGVSAGGWGDDRWTNYFARANVRDWTTRQTPIAQPPYSTAYPGIESLPRSPMVNYITRNLVMGDAPVLRGSPKNERAGNARVSTRAEVQELVRRGLFDPLPPESALGAAGDVRPARAIRNENL